MNNFVKNVYKPKSNVRNRKGREQKQKRNIGRN